MNTRQLRHLLAVVESGSVSAAAERVHLSQPALSRSLQALEDELRAPLFDRHERRLVPTPFTQAYLARARRIVFEEAEGARELALMHSGRAGSLAIGMGSALAQRMLGRLLMELMAGAPRLRLRTLVETTDRLLDALRNEELDFFIGDVRVADTDGELQVEPLYACRFGWFARHDHPLRTKRALPIRDVLRYPLIAPGFIGPDAERQFLRRYGLTGSMLDRFTLRCADGATVLAVLMATDAIVPAIELTMLEELRDGSVIALDVVPALDAELVLGIVQRAGRTQVPAAGRAFAFVRQYFASLG
ncbi:MAG TPA: LysR family transcriptional regulator [Caldimonas sp.]|nr:LysR family transcriptional regulator [Caldimonas sp.]HEX4235753.1 LysR family transcriptional regulator [Caldimonas sp.]